MIGSSIVTFWGPASLAMEPPNFAENHELGTDSPHGVSCTGRLERTRRRQVTGEGWYSFTQAKRDGFFIIKAGPGQSENGRRLYLMMQGPSSA